MDLSRSIEDELRAIVNEAVRRGSSAPVLPAGAEGHPSHGRLRLASGGDQEGACLIQPEVRCTHCGYCQSYGH